jgi:hypothetical protein
VGSPVALARVTVANNLSACSTRSVTAAPMTAVRYLIRLLI